MIEKEDGDDCFKAKERQCIVKSLEVAAETCSSRSIGLLLASAAGPTSRAKQKLASSSYTSYSLDCLRCMHTLTLCGSKIDLFPGLDGVIPVSSYYLNFISYFKKSTVTIKKE
jgi:hypothetical protein